MVLRHMVFDESLFLFSMETGLTASVADIVTAHVPMLRPVLVPSVSIP